MAPPPSYHATLLKMIGYLDGVQHAKGTEIPQARLRTLTPSDLMRWFNHITFGTENPDDEAKPTARSSSLEFYKKALSHYMPNRLMVWNEISGVGNPTRCTQINDLIKRVKKMEVRKQGVPSRARRALTHEEYRATHVTLKNHGRNRDTDTMNIIWNFGCVAAQNFQFHTMARVDDSMNFKMENIRKCPGFPFYFQSRLNWSKNVREERDAPYQIMLPSMNPVYCVYFSLALWLEIFIMKCPHALLTPFTFGFSQDTTLETGANASKNIVQGIFGGRIFKESNTAIRDSGGSGCLGTHSVRKMSSTHARRSGANKDERDIRGRWKGKQRVGDRYDDVELPWPDLKVAQMLCIGGPCKYVVKSESGVNDAFIFEFVVPNIRKRFDDDVTLILGTVLLYMIYQDEDNQIPNFIKKRVLDAMPTVSRTPNENPVRRIPVVCTGNDGEVYIDEILSAEETQGRQPSEEAQGSQATEQRVTGSLTDRPIRDQLRAVQSQLQGIKNMLAEIDKRQVADALANTRQLQTINANIKRVGLSPGRPIRATTSNPISADLSAHPRTLYELWDEYNNGIGGRKPAREFSAQERGKVKYKYYRRKKFWDLVSGLTRNGLEAHVAIDRIYQVYGRGKSVTQIIQHIIIDKKRGYTPPMLAI